MDPAALEAIRVATPRPVASASPLQDGAVSGREGPSFSERLLDAVGEANRSLTDAERSARELAEGKADVVETVIALSHAELSLRHVVTLRDRVFAAYQEIMRLQL